MNLARALTPFKSSWSLVFGPVFQKEVYVSGRRNATYLVRSLVALLLFAVLVITCIPLAFDASDGQGVVRLQKSQELATILTAVVIGFDFGILMLFTPIIIVPSVMEEVTKRTLPALLTTPITAAEIVFGKLLGRGVNIIVLALIPMPILLVLRTLGGVPGDAIVATVAMLVTATILIGSLSIFISVWSRKPGSGIVASFIFFIAIQAFPPIVLTILTEKLKIVSVPDTLTASLSVCSALFITLLHKLGGETIPGVSTEYMWMVNSLYNLIIASILLLISVLMLRRVMRREGSGVTNAEANVPVKSGAKAVESDPKPAPSVSERSQREVSDQPVLWREVRQPLFAKRKHLYVAIAAILGLLGLIFYLGKESPGTAMQISLGIAMILSLLGSAVLTASSIGTERDSQTWEVLLTTSLSAREILWGKFLGILKRQAIVPLLGAAFIFFGGVGLLGRVHPAEILLWLCHTTGPIVFLSASGVFFSLLFRKSTVAAVWNLLLALLLWAASPAICAIICFPLERYLFQQDLISSKLLSGVLIFNPVFCFFATVGSDVLLSGDRWGTNGSVNLVGSNNVSVATFMVISVLVCAGYFAAAYAIMSLSRALFPRLSGRVARPASV